MIPGNILFRQRGTHWFPGDNCFMVCLVHSVHRLCMLTAPQGRDHTIHAGAPGFVRYYRDPLRHPKRKYIGIVFEKDQSLPQAPTEPRRRKLGMLAYELPSAPTDDAASEFISGGAPEEINEAPQEVREQAILRNSHGNGQATTAKLRPGYQYRQANWEIGRLQDRREAEAQARGRTTRLYPDFKPGNRFAAWRKRAVRVQASMERRSVGRKGAKKVKN